MVKTSVIWGAVLLIFVGCQHPKPKEKGQNHQDTKSKMVMEPYENYGYAVDSFKTGDLLVRHSQGWSSDIFRGASGKDKRFSHAGILLKNADGSAEVYHMLGGADNPTFNLKKDSVQAWCSPKFAVSFAAFRYDLTDNQRLFLDSLVRTYYKNSLGFDMNFDLSTDDRMYCSEFIYKVLLYTTNDENYIPLSEENGKSFVALDNLYLNKHSKQLISYEHKKHP